MRGRRVGAVREHERDLGREVRRARGLDERRPCSSRGPRSGWRSRRRGHQSFSCPDVRTCSPPSCDDRFRRCAPGFRRHGEGSRSRASACSGAATTIMPMPQLKVRSISALGDAAGAGKPAENRRHGDRVEIEPRRRRRPAARAGMLSGKPPPVIWASALMPSPAFRAARSGFT